MEYTPTDITKEKLKGGGMKASFMLRDKHTVVYAKSGLIYVDGKEMTGSYSDDGYRFQIEGLDCLLYVKTGVWGNAIPHFEVGGITIF